MRSVMDISLRWFNVRRDEFCTDLATALWHAYLRRTTLRIGDMIVTTQHKHTQYMRGIK